MSLTCDNRFLHFTSLVHESDSRYVVDEHNFSTNTLVAQSFDLFKETCSVCDLMNETLKKSDEPENISSPATINNA
jgi:hypothetical protein